MIKKIKLLIYILTASILISGCDSGDSGKPAIKPDNMKVITDVTGKSVRLKDAPERIVILHALYLDYFFAIDTPPAASTGASTGTAMEVIDRWETLKTFRGKSKIADLGSARNLNIEAVLAAEPDVIVAFKGQIDNLYDKLVQIAPVVQVDFQDSWQNQLRLCAAVAGREIEAEKYINDTERLISETREKLQSIKGKTIAIFRTDGKSFITRADLEFYETFGLTKPEMFPDDYQPLSIETVGLMNPDYIILQGYRKSSEAFVRSLETSTIWQSLKAVRQNDIYFFDDSLNTLGPLAMRLTAEKLLDIYTSDAQVNTQ